VVVVGLGSYVAAGFFRTPDVNLSYLPKASGYQFRIDIPVLLKTGGGLFVHDAQPRLNGDPHSFTFHHTHSDERVPPSPSSVTAALPTRKR